MTARPILLRFGLAASVFFVAQTANSADDTVSFELDVQPILSAKGCNAGACHGKQRGQNGFQLSLLGFDADFDHAALTKNGRGRRVSAAAPSSSLLLLKASAQLPHGGGKRLDIDGEDYAVVQRWIAAGAPRRVMNEPRLERIAVEPLAVQLAPGETAELHVTAFYSDGSSRDVTSRTTFQSNETGFASVDEVGVVTAGTLHGETAVMARYMNLIGVTGVTIPFPAEVSADDYVSLPRYNFIDELIWKKLESLRIAPAPQADDAKFLRRIYLDIIGRLPTVDEAREFLAGDSPARRGELIDHLLDRPEYADHWANQWADLLRPNPYRAGIKATLNFDDWIRQQFRENRPYNEFVRDLVTARGSTWQNGAATLFRDRRSPEETATIISQLFLGIRLECAKCHHHPFEKWGQDDFYSFAAYFARVGRKGQGVSPPISGGEEVIFTAKQGSVNHPLSGEVIAPRPLYGQARESSEQEDPRVALAEWITGGENESFARVQVNRVWAELMGRGLVTPVDDLRSTNPPTNEPLLAALAEEFRNQRYDLKQLLRTITSSYAYSLSSLPGGQNATDTANYSRHYRQQLRAEVMLGAFDDITGVPTRFTAMPPGARPNQLWTHRINSLFLDTFGRPNENQDPPCERLVGGTVTQSLHLMNSPALHTKVTSDSGRAAELAKSDKTPDQIVEELYLAIYSRFPDDTELDIGRHLFASADITRRQATEDLMWALLNTPEFLFKD